nr:MULTISPECIES: hypothetical protein [unclassified Pseudomonas]
MGNEVEDICEYLATSHGIRESYVLVRHIKLFLETESAFTPELGIKIWKSHIHPDYPYHFETSHHIHTPTQAGPYYPSRTVAQSERQAIDQALASITGFLNGAIQSGHQPADDWLVPNEDF